MLSFFFFPLSIGIHWFTIRHKDCYALLQTVLSVSVLIWYLMCANPIGNKWPIANPHLPAFLFHIFPLFGMTTFLKFVTNHIDM